jgi:hypothetical protein
MTMIEQLVEIRVEEAREQTRKEDRVNFVNNLLLNTRFKEERIAFLTGAPLEFVKKMRTSLRKK